MKQLAIQLRPDEQALLNEIELDGSAVTHEVYKRNAEFIIALWDKLTGRNAIPEHRLKYFTDPEYSHLAHGRSWEQIFERNGTRGQDTIRHPNFLRFFRYFLKGPELPQAVIDAFSQEVDACGGVTSGDVVPLSHFARQQARDYRMEPKVADEEFYKLALDCGIWPSYAEAIRRAVRQIRYR